VFPVRFRRVTLSYRQAAFSRLKDRNEKRIEECIKAKKLEVLFNSKPVEIKDASVLIEVEGTVREEADPQNVDALYNVGAIYGNQGNIAEAKAYFAKAVAADASSDSGEKSKAAIAQLDAPTPKPGAIDPNTPLPPGHPTMGAVSASVGGGSTAAGVDKLLTEGAVTAAKK
jgi:hypothetical protein